MRRKYATVAERKAAKARTMAADYLKNKDAYKANARQWRLNNPERTLLLSARGRAKKSGLPFNLTIEDIVIPEFCPVLGIKLEPNRGGNRSPGFSSPTIDKLVPSRGYVRGNIAIISHRANTIKNSATLAEVMKVCGWMVNNVPE